MLVLYILSIVFFSLVLFKSAEILSIHLKSVAKKTQMGGFFLTSLIIALATSLPELFVGVTSALNNIPNLSLGNVIGANIANVTLVAGGAALIGGSIRIRNHAYASDLLHSFLAAMAPLFLLMDNVLSRVDALILIALYGFYNVSLLKRRSQEILDEEENIFSLFVRKFTHQKVRKDLMFIFLSAAVLLFSADMIVRLGQNIASELGISLLLVGIFFVAIGTSLPEFMVDFKAIRDKDTAMFMGNMLGSIVTNGTLIVGVVALISPITINAYTDYLVATLFFLLVFLYFYFFVRTKQRLDRWEGLALIIAYLVFLAIEFLR